MKLSRDEEIRLERWLNHRLDHESNAETLSRYVLSLLKEERGDNRQFVQDELRTFLKDNTTQFVDSLFSALKDGSYKGVQMESEETGDDQLERRNSMDGRRERSGSDDSRSRGRLRRRYSDDAADRERDYRDRDREERDRSRSRDRHSGRDKERDRGGDNFRDRNKGSGDRWKDRSGNYRNNSNNNNRGGYQTFRKNDQSNKTEHYPQPVEQPMPWMQGGFMPPQMNAPYPNPYPWNPAAPPPGSAPYYPPPFNPYGMPYPPPAYPPYNPFGPPPDASNNQPMYNPNQFHPQPVTTPTTTENPTAPSNADEMEEVKPENADTITVTPQKAETESTEISSKDENKASYEDELYAQNTPISPPVYPPPMWNYDANYMMYGQGYGNNNSNNNAGSNNNINKNNRGFNNDNNNNNRRRNNNNNSNNNNNNNKTQLPENERCTIRCTGIPTSIKEEDIRAHFECFGSIVKLEISPMEDHNNNNNNNNNQDSLDGNEKDKKKTYNECLVQFYSAANAKKCLTSQAPVLSNRFIRLHASSFNIIMPSDVDPPSYDMIENDKALLTQDIQPQPYDPHKKKATLASTHKIGVTNKWRRPDPKTAVNSEESGNGVENPNTLTTTSTDNEGSSSAAQVAAKKENEELKQEFEQLKTLKQQAEDILKQKEKVLLESVEKCRAMLEKLESAEENEKKTSFLQNLENKIVDLQAQLRTVREQMEKGVASADSYNKPYPGFRGGPSGRMPYYGGRAAAYARGGFAPTGRGRGYGRQNKYVNANAAPIAGGANNFFGGGGNPFLQQSQATSSSVTNSSVEESETTEMQKKMIMYELYQEE